MSLDYNKGQSRSVPLRRGASFLWQKSFTINGQVGSLLLLIIPQTEANSSRIPDPAPSLQSSSVASSLPLYNWVLKILVGGGNQRTTAFTFPFFCMWSKTFWIWCRRGWSSSQCWLWRYIMTRDWLSNCNGGKGR